MSQYLLGIDAGGTKTKARLESSDGEEKWSVRDGPASLTNDRAGAIKCVISAINELLDKANVKSEQVSMVCGIAGSNHEAARLALEHRVEDLELAHYQITSDAITSVYGAGKGRPLLCVAVGTGSVAVRLHADGSTELFGGWGFIGGDQGSGADLGRKFVRGALEHFDAGDYLEDELYRALFDDLGQNSQEIMAWLNTAKATDYARLMHVMQRFPEHPRVIDLLDYAGKATSRLIGTALGGESTEIVLMGGLANYILPYIDDAFRPNLVDAEGDALDGAIWMAAKQSTKGKSNV